MFPDAVIFNELSYRNFKMKPISFYRAFLEKIILWNLSIRLLRPNPIESALFWAFKDKILFREPSIGQSQVFISLLPSLMKYDMKIMYIHQISRNKQNNKTMSKLHTPVFCLEMKLFFPNFYVTLFPFPLIFVSPYTQCYTEHVRIFQHLTHLVNCLQLL